MLLLTTKRGDIVYHAIAGKNTIGTASPGNNSGFFILKGKEAEMGIIIRENDIIENKRLKTISPFVFNKKVRIQYNIPATKQTKRLEQIMESGFIILEKSVSVAKK